MTDGHPYKIDGSLFETELLRLLAILYGSKQMNKRAIKRWRAADKLDPSENYTTTQFPFWDKDRLAAWAAGQLKETEEREASRIIITLAIFVRNDIDAIPHYQKIDQSHLALVAKCLTDTKKALSDEDRAKAIEDPTQAMSLFSDAGCKSEEFTVCETCNKIIHAKSIFWGRRDLDPPKEARKQGIGAPLDGRLWLSGELQGNGRFPQPWICEVDVERFCLHCL